MDSKNRHKVDFSTETIIPLRAGETLFLGVVRAEKVHMHLNLEKNCLLTSRLITHGFSHFIFVL